MTTMEVVLVPHAEDMSDETFVRHMMARHAGDVLAPLELDGALRCGTLAVLDAFRRFHERLHALATPDRYDHEHDDPTPV